MATNQDTLFRQWHMLRFVPRYPQKVTVQSLWAMLRAEGFEMTERTVQRDLNELSSVFPLVVDDREKPFGWSWQKEAPHFNLPGLTLPEAMTLSLANQHLAALMPASMMDQLSPYFEAARQRLAAEPAPHRGRSWLNKVRAIPPTQRLLPPEILPEVQALITDALLHERQVEIKYRKRGEKGATNYRIHPLGLIQRGPMLYLYCLFDQEDGRTLAMNRILSAKLLDEPAIYPKDFSLDASIDEGVGNFGDGSIIKVDLLFSDGYGNHLLECPLSKDQQVQDLGNGCLKVSATLTSTPQLKWWLLGFGGHVEVVEPPVLRQEIAGEAKLLAERYAS